MSKIMRNYLVGLFIAIVIYVPVVSWLIIRNIILPPEVIDTLILFILAAATVFYAFRTSDIAKAAEKQAEASRRMAEDMARPYLLLRLTEEYLQWDDIEGGQSAAKEFTVTVLNGGKGPARNLEASLWSHEDIFAVNKKGYLAANQEWEATISKLSTDGIALGEEIPWLELKDVIRKKRISVVVKYEDIYHHHWVSYLYLEDVDDTGYVRDGEQNIVELNQND